MKTLLPNSLQQQASLYKLNRAIAASKFHPVNWKPFPGSPQEAAYRSEADELFYGGAAGGGKTDLGLGLAGTQHQRSVIFRRVFPSVRGMIERSREIYNYTGSSHAKDSFNEGLHIWRLNDGRLIEFGSCQYEKDKEKQRGIPRDLYVFDELPEFTESQFRFIKIWNRTADPNQRCRVLCTGNPPTTPEGEWVVRYWAPWLDPDHPNPAEPGELRWFAVIDGQDVEVESSNSFMHNGEEIFPRSRTFIPARLQDNPVYMETGYLATLQALPEPLRSQMLYGDFSVGTDDDSWQVIPTAWILEAEQRYRERQRPAINCRSIGVDPSRGGDDEFAIARLYGSWFEVDAFPGSDAPDGESGAMLVEQVMTNPAPMWVDVIGYGAAVFDALKHSHEAHPVNVGSASSATDQSGMYEFNNLRSEQWWAFREALDPASGHDIALPPDRKLRQDLRAPRYKRQGKNIVVEKKEDIKKRTGRSTDRADAVLMAWHGATTGHVEWSVL